MWCAHCQADVAGEVSADARSLLCTTCGGEVSSIKAPGNLPSTRGARELLERWNTEEALEPYQPGRRQRLADQLNPPTELDAAAELTERPKRRRVRTDGPHFDRHETAADTVSAAKVVSAEAEPIAADADSTRREARVARRPQQRKFRVDAQHAADSGTTSRAPHEPRDVYAAHDSRLDASHNAAPSPHFDITAAFDQRRKPGRGESLWGQLLAYAGVGVLTVGTGLVVWGYFGGPDSYTPTGWLLATAGQMLLFLGVVTLISGGMEQTTHEVTQRIERLGDHIMRIERHTAEQSLRGPHFATSEAVDASPSKRRTESADV